MKDIKIKSNKVILASDHAGFKLKEAIKKFLIKKRKMVLDLGAKNSKPVDYPDYAHLLSKKIKNNQFGILISYPFFAWIFDPCIKLKNNCLSFDVAD